MTKPKGPIESYALNHPDKGCKYADEFLGVPKGESRCLDCPFGEVCVKDMESRLRTGFIKGFSNGQAIGLIVGLDIGQNIEEYTKIKEV